MSGRRAVVVVLVLLSAPACGGTADVEVRSLGEEPPRIDGQPLTLYTHYASGAPSFTGSSGSPTRRFTTGRGLESAARAPMATAEQARHSSGRAAGNSCSWSSSERAKSGDQLLGGISSRRLASFPVNLNR